MIEFIRENMRYEPETGELFWVAHPSKSHQRLIGKPALTAFAGRGYRYGKVNGKWCYLHQVAVAFMTGEWPSDQVDHINGDITDNRWKNLRVVTQHENTKNRSTRFGGIRHNKNVGPDTWRAEIKVDGKSINLGSFTDKDAAIAARKAAERKYGFHPNHGRTG